jgi:hypothetical protein
MMLSIPIKTATTSKKLYFFLNGKTQSGHTIPRTLRKQELHTPGCPLIIHKRYMRMTQVSQLKENTATAAG